MRRVTAAIALECYAVILAVLQATNHVRTDEAKYLLNIPYPHPPLVREILGMTEWIPFQEMLWRVIFATIVVQAAWLIVSLSLGERVRERGRNGNSSYPSSLPSPSGRRNMLLGAFWLLSFPVLSQAGTIMMAPLTAVEGLLLLFICHEAAAGNGCGWGKNNATAAPLRGCGVMHPALLGLFWLASLFTAYQALLFAPIVVAILLRMRIPFWQRIVCFGGPIFVLALYTLSNPLSLASFVLVKDSGAVTIMDRFREVGILWLLGGSIVLSILGTIGIVLSRRWELIATFLLIAAYAFMSPQGYYAILWVPVLLMGTGTFCTTNMTKRTCPLIAVCTLMLTAWFPPWFHPSPVRSVMHAIAARGDEGDILINGPFGHEWQYESRIPVRTYNSAFLPAAQAVICLAACGDAQEGWKPLDAADISFWVRQAE